MDFGKTQAEETRQMLFGKWFLLFSLLCASLCLTSTMAEGSDLAVDHWAYDYLDRLKVKGLLNSFLNQTRPIPREEVAEAIWEVFQAAKIGDPRLTEVERSQLEWLQMEFKEELEHYAPSQLRRERHLFHWSDPHRGLTLDAVGRSQGTLSSCQGENQRILDTRMEIRARGFLGKELTYAASVVKGQVNSNLKRVTKNDVGLTEFFNSRGSYAYYDWSHAHLNLRLPWMDLQLARQPISWGPGVRGNLALSDQPPAYDFVQIRASFHGIKFVHLHGFLFSDVKTVYQTAEGFIRESYANKYLAAHRLEIGLHSRACLGLTEAIIYGERNLDLAYLNPLVFFWSAQHSSHDRDNEILSADLRFWPIAGVTLYGALFLDELYLKKLFADDARNKIAVQGGVYLVDPMGLRDTDLRLEYARIQPCLYTHKFPVNTYRHNGVILGHWLEENGDDLYLEARHRLSRNLRIAIQMTRTRQGERGEQPWCHAESWRYSFLWGIVERTVTLGCTLDVEPIHNFRTAISYKRVDRRNKDHQTGADEIQHELFLSLIFDY